MKRTISLIVVALLLNCWSAINVLAFDTELPRPDGIGVSAVVSSLVDSKELSGAQISILAVNTQGDTLVSINPNQRLIPASNIKIISSGLALNLLGKDYRYPTHIAYSGEIVNGVLNGDIYIIGGGDPTTGANLPFVQNINSLFAKWKSILSNNGIKSINGRIIADPRVYNTEHSEYPSWEYEDLGYYFGTGPNGLNFYENAQRFTIKPGANLGAKPSISVYYPQTPWMSYKNYASTAGKGTKNTLVYTNTHLFPVGEFIGNFPIDRKAYTYEASNRFAAFTLAYYFYNYLNSSGLRVKKYADIDSEGYIREDLVSSVDKPAAANPTIIGTTYSPPLYQIIAHTLAESDNFFAESLLRSIGYKAGNIEDYGVAAAVSAIEALGIDKPFRLADGCGLSRHNYASAGFFVDFLNKMSDNQDFIKLMPYPGTIGSLEFKFKDAPESFKERIRMKSGSMSGVLCYSGYILPSEDQGETIIFSILVNNFVTKVRSIMPTIDTIIQSISECN